MIWFCCWLIALASTEREAEDATEWMKPAAWSGSFWGPAASRARLGGELPPLPMTPAMTRWGAWGRKELRDGDILFRLGDARTLRGIIPVSLFIARATGSPFSHTAIVAIEDGSPMVYDASPDGIRRMPFEAWMVECVGPMGVKRPMPKYRGCIPGVTAYCRTLFEQQVPFDYEFRMDDDALYCLELTEKAFRSQGMRLSEPVRIGDWEHLTSYPLTGFGIPIISRLMLKRPISLEQLVYLPGNCARGCGPRHCWRRFSVRNRSGTRMPVPERRAASACGEISIWPSSPRASYTVLTVNSTYDGSAILLYARGSSNFSRIAVLMRQASLDDQ